MLAEEVLATLEQMTLARAADNVSIFAATKTLQCPGKRTTPVNHPVWCNYDGLNSKAPRVR